MAYDATQPPPGSSHFGKLLGALTIGALIWFTRKSKPAAKKDESHSAAFRDGETHKENFDQTRSAGPEAMRDTPSREWTSVDQAGDESFPASDPPSY